MTVRVSGDGSKSLLALLADAATAAAAASASTGHFPEPANMLSFLPTSPCGGNGTCGKCAVRLVSGITDPTPADSRVLSAALLGQGYRLACQCHPLGSCAVDLEPPEGFRVVSSYSVPAFIPGFPLSSRASYGIAIDIGTTTIAMELVDARTGAPRSSDARLNGQSVFGADVLSRVRSAGEGNAERLRDAIRSDILRGIGALLSGSDLSGLDIGSFAIAGNTVMIHLLLALPVDGLGRSPFRPAALRFPGLTFADVFGISGEIAGDCPVAIVPCMSAFIGGDIVSGLAALEIQDGKERALFIDLGTNAEMALIHDGVIHCAAAAAGPAFEGGSISCGTGSISGAVSSIGIEGNRFVWEVVGDAASGDAASSDAASSDATASGDSPPGLCGSAILDLVACSLDLGLIREDGALSPACAASGILLDPKGKIVLTGADVREIQLAKAAIRAGIAVLLDSAGIQAESVSRVFLAGGFGLYLKEKSALRIGLLPPAFAGKTVAVGNTSLAGVSRLIADRDIECRFDAILAAGKPVNLAESELFGDLFIGSLGFGEYRAPTD